MRDGDHATVVAIGRMVAFAEKALDALAKDGIICDLIDPRTHLAARRRDDLRKPARPPAGW